MDRMPEEETLALLVSEGDPRALTILYERYVSQIYRYFSSRISNRAEVEDCVSDTFARALDALTQGRFHRREGKPFRAWLFAIARNVWMEHCRKKYNSESLESHPECNELEDLQEDVLDSLLRKEVQDVIWQLVDELGPDEQLILKLRYLFKFSYTKIARRFGRSEDAWKQLRYRALGKLKSKICEHHLCSEILSFYDS